MDPNTFPTKGNLILAKNSLALAKDGKHQTGYQPCGRNLLLRTG